MAKNISDEQKNKIIELYLSGMSRKDIHKITGHSTSTIGTYTKGKRTHKDSVILFRKQGKGKITESGRNKLSISGKEACKINKKFATLPEILFIFILREIGYKIKIPEYVLSLNKEMQNDINGEIFYQYPLQRYVCDFVWPEKNIVFNINGDFWHANPILYDYSKLTKIQKTNIYRDNNKRIFLDKLGWNIVDIWESDIYWNREKVKERVAQLASVSGLHPGGCRGRADLAHSEDWSNRLRDLWFKKSKKPKNIIVYVDKKCNECGIIFSISQNNKKLQSKKFCSNTCYKAYRINHYKYKENLPRIPKEQLENDIKKMPFLEIGKKYGVSDNAIRKWAKKLNLPYKKADIKIFYPEKFNKKIEIKCQVCSNIFTDYPSNKRKYCSHKCSFIGIRGKRK